MNSNRVRLHAGTASVLLVFVTLCLVSFAVLSITGANADLRLSRKTAARNEAYYNAHNEAVRLLADTDRALVSLLEESADEASFLALARERFPDARLTASFPISELQSLCVEARIAYPADGLQNASPAHASGIRAHCLVITKFCVETNEKEYRIEENILNLPH